MARGLVMLGWNSVEHNTQSDAGEHWNALGSGMLWVLSCGTESTLGDPLATGIFRRVFVYVNH